jgi:3-oxoacyl-[acyl-carrier protein] reductase
MFTMLGKKVPLQRVGMPEDIAGAALFLASQLSSWITGQALYVAGGLPLQPLASPQK